MERINEDGVSGPPGEGIQRRGSGVRTRGGGTRLRRGRVRTRGGINSSENVASAFIPSRGRVRGRGQRRTTAARMQHCSSPFYSGILLKRRTENVQENFVAEGDISEQPLNPKIPRRWPPITITSNLELDRPESSGSETLPTAYDPMALETLAAPDSPIETTDTHASNAIVAPDLPVLLNSPVTPTLPELILSHNVPSPAQFLECDSALSGPSTPCSSRSHNYRTQNLRNQDIQNILNYGSEDDSVDDDDDDDGMPFTYIPRNQRILIYDEEPSAPMVVCAPVTPCEPTSLTERALFVEPGPLVEYVPVEHKPVNMFDFNWMAMPNPPIPWQERREPFTRSVGPTEQMLDPYQAFMAIWDQNILQHIVDETNRYAAQHTNRMVGESRFRRESRMLYWKEITLDEIVVYFALLIAMGLVVKTNITEYWSKTSDIFETPGFKQYMSYNRFQLISRCLHFNSNEVDITNLSPPAAKVYKIAPIVQHLNTAFQRLYNLSQNIALDESLTMWKGWLSIKQFIRNKAATVGIKTYELCDSSTGYLWRFDVHAGREEPDPQQEISPIAGYIPTLVLKLLSGLDYRGHTIWMDNFYNSPALSRTLKSRGFDCVGTLRTNRQFVPSELAALTKQNMTLGETHGSTSGDVDIIIWRDQNRVPMTSTYHGLASYTRDGHTKPTVVHDYNVRMGGVDKKDQMLATYPMERKRTRIWYKKFFRRLLNVSVLNAFILLKHECPEISHRSFRKILVSSLLAKHGPARATLGSGPSTSVSRPPAFSAEIQKHMPAEYPFNEKRTQRLRKTCFCCSKRTQSYCPECNVPLCIFSCYGKYHT